MDDKKLTWEELLKSDLTDEQLEELLVQSGVARTTAVEMILFGRHDYQGDRIEVSEGDEDE